MRRDDPIYGALYSVDESRSASICKSSSTSALFISMRANYHDGGMIIYFVNRPTMIDMVKKEVFKRYDEDIFVVQPTDCMLADAGFAVGLDIKDVLDEMSQMRMRRRRPNLISLGG